MTIATQKEFKKNFRVVESSLSPEKRLTSYNVAQIHFFSESEDGVSLQIQETKRQLTALGVNNFTFSADF